MKTAIFLLCFVAVSLAQDATRPPPTRDPLFTRPPPLFTRPPFTEGTRPPPDSTRYDTRDNPESRCDILDRRCEEGERCIERPTVDSVINECMRDVRENGTCMRRDIFEGDSDRERVLDDKEFMAERVDKERSDGARDRDTARTINGVEERPRCQFGFSCMDNMCRRPENMMCIQQRMTDRQLRCGDDGMFEPLQCRLPQPPATEGTQQPRSARIALNCSCVRPSDGQMIADTMRRVMSRQQLPDCNTRSFRSCNIMRDRMVSVRHGDSVPMSRNGQCQRCECEDGRLNCNNVDERCPRSDPDQRPANCMADGEEVEHGQTRQDGRCNMCRCVNGRMRCTRARACRGEDNDAGSDRDRDSEDRRCDECMDMPNGPVCAMRDGRTFPTRCHAMRCQGFEMSELRDGPCSERNSCEEERCGADSRCMRRGGETKMSREDDSPDSRRLCVNREELRCQPTRTRADGTRVIRDDDEDDIIEVLNFNDDDEEDDETIRDEDDEDDDDDDDDDAEDDRTVCASDGNTYPSTCHMMAESRAAMPPRVMHMGRCRPMRPERMVCATDGVTYADERTMRTIGGNVRMDYMGRCDDPDNNEDNTPAQRCMRVRESGRCPRLMNCSRRGMPEDGCCPICGSLVHLAVDQDALDEHIRTTDRLSAVDDFMGQMFRTDGDRDPIIDRMAPRRCEISMTRPTKSPGNSTEVMFRARNTTRDGGYCHEQAMRMVMKLNQEKTVVTTEESLIAAAIVLPEQEVIGPGGGAPAFTASCVMLISATIIAVLF